MAAWQVFSAHSRYFSFTPSSSPPQSTRLSTSSRASFLKSGTTSAARGQVDQIIEKALEDGVIERHEAEWIMVHHRRHLAAREEEIAAIITLFSRKKK